MAQTEMKINKWLNYYRRVYTAYKGQEGEGHLECPGWVTVEAVPLDLQNPTTLGHTTTPRRYSSSTKHRDTNTGRLTK